MRNGNLHEFGLLAHDALIPDMKNGSGRQVHVPGKTLDGRIQVSRITMTDEVRNSDLFSALRKRHACRSFDISRSVPDEILKKLIYAAHRAPTGGGTPYRFLIAVRDPIQLKMLSLVSPGLFGKPPLVFVICSMTKIGDEPLPKMDLEECTHIDAGAAAENIALVAYSLGLGACFVKSYAEVAVARLLELPPDTRTEIMVSVGYPSQVSQPSLKKGKKDKLTYIDKYGVEFVQ